MSRAYTTLFIALLFSLFSLGGCEIPQRCYRDQDCPGKQVCAADGSCQWRCQWDYECGEGFVCRDHECTPEETQPLECPEEMASILDSFCMDRWEASRPDAGAYSPGEDERFATSAPGVMPWRIGDENDLAETACQAAGKRLCSPTEWTLACQGASALRYAYGDTYEPETCNGIDTFGRDGFHLLPTGSLEDCENNAGVYDLNGNLWEHTSNGSGKTVRGGAYNCSDSRAFHQCEFVPRTWTPSALGFRCCLGRDDEPPLPLDELESEALDSVDLSQDTPLEDAECLEEDFGGDQDQNEVDAELDLEEDLLDSSDLTEDLAEVEDTSDGDIDPIAPCPLGMVIVSLSGGSFCMDRYEASHLDATSNTQGSDPTAQSLAGVIPWFPVDLPSARVACEAAGKRLCALDEWVGACHGSQGTNYVYGDDYDPTICNGIDAFCDCQSETCQENLSCPYAHCRADCGAPFHVVPTGSFSDCINEWGVQDVNGNVWELADSDDGLEHFRGGAYNCSNSESLHRCDHDGTWGPSARGFRCCADLQAPDPQPSPAKPITHSTTQPPRGARLNAGIQGAINPLSGQSPAPLSPGALFVVWREEDLMAQPRGLSSSPESKEGKGLEASPRKASTCQTDDCALEEARTLLKESPEAAVIYLKEARKRFPESPLLTKLLAIAYLESGNHFWARKVLHRYLKDQPEDCSARSWLSFSYLEKAELMTAIKTLKEGECTPRGPESLRHDLLEASALILMESPEDAKDVLSTSRLRSQGFEEDIDALSSLEGALFPGRAPEFSWRAKAGVGYSSNASLSTPDETVLSDEEGASPRFSLDTWVRLSPAPERALRSFVELDFKSRFLSAEQVRDLSSLSLGGRAGLEIDLGTPRVIFAYHPEWLGLSKGDRYEDGPLWYYSGHRGEVEIELGPRLLLFSGVGRRTFREEVRTRTELDGGLGGWLPLWRELSLAWALIVRKHFANGSAYRALGGGALTKLNLRHGDWTIGLAGQLSMDDFDQSAGYFAEDAREDLFTRLSADLWYQLWHGGSIGVELRYARRDSSIPRYEFDEYRAELALRLGGQATITGPDEREGPLWPMSWSMGGDSSAERERIQDLLRQDEDVQRSSSCVQ